MKRALFLILTTLTVFIAYGQQEEELPGQKSLFQPYVAVGFNATQVAGDDLAGYHKIGANIGVGVFINMPKSLSFSFELSYSQKGSKSGNNEYPEGGPRKLILDYIDVPVFFNYHDKQRAIFGTGPVFGFKSRYKEERGDTLGFWPDVDVYKTIDIAWGVSIAFIFKQHYGVQLRGAYSLVSIADRRIPGSNIKDQGQKHNVVSLRVFYLF